MNAPPKALLLLDVDGPLNPYRLITKKGHLPPKARNGEEPFAYHKHLLRPPGWETGEPLPVLLSAKMGQAVHDLSDLYTLVWATTWVEHANTLLAPLLGLPRLPVIEWPEVETRQEWTRGVGGHRGSWKSKWIARWLDAYAVYKTPAGDMARIPWVWVDDEINQHDRAFFRDHYGEARGGPRRVDRWLFRIEASHGLRANDFADLRDWAERVAVEKTAEPTA